MKNERTILTVSDLGVRRGSTNILKNVDWKVMRGEHWIILGANGSGKTSLLSALTAYLTPTCGEVELLGKRYGETNWQDLRKRIGLVSSAIRQMMPETEPALTAVVSGKYAMIDYWGRISKSDRARARRILKQIECEYLAERPWIFLSQGERQRVLIGRALMADPNVLILDEPCAGLDPAAREHFLQFIERLGRRKFGPTIILVTHHVEEIMPVFSHVLMLKSGRVMASGEKTNVLNSRTLTETFGARIRLRASRDRFTLAVEPTSKVVI